MKLKNNERLDDLQYKNLFIIQNKDDYCFTSDAINLANFVHVSNFGRVVDLCSGSGVIGILVNAKNKVKDVILVELQKQLADMSLRSIQYNDLKNFQVINAPVQNVNKIIGKNVFDVVVCNPPYKVLGTTNKLNDNESIAIAKHEIKITLEEIIKEASSLLKFGGYFYIVNKEDRLVDIFTLCRKYNLEPKELKIIKSNVSSIVLVRAKKGGKSGIKISL